MGLRRIHARHSGRVIKSSRWKAVRLTALRRDDFACRHCGARGRLEVDHIIPVRDAPERAFDLDNLQTLCPSCHARKTRIEVGLGQPDPKRQEWRELVRCTATPQPTMRK